MLWVILNKSWKLHPSKQLQYAHLPPISKTIQKRWTRYGGHCWRSKEELISNILLWASSHGRVSVGRLTRTYLQQLWTDTECCQEDQLEAMDDRVEWRARVWEIRASCVTWWWWYIYIYIYMCVCVCVCVCLRERERKWDRKREK